MSQRRRRRPARQLAEPATPATPRSPADDEAATGSPADRTLYDRYRDALRVGHLAALRGNREMANRAYLEAAALLPDRAAPYVGLGRAELAAGRPADALSAYQAALQRAPSDTAALDGAARALIAQQRPNEAADLLDRLAITHLEHDRGADALETIERALDLADSRWRRSALDRLRAGVGASDRSWLGDLPSSERAGIANAQAADPSGGRTTAEPVSDELRELAERVERASATDDVPGLLDGAVVLARAGRLRAAIDACHDALSIAPGEPQVHRTLAAIYRRRGWTDAARNKLKLVDRFLEVTDDPDALDVLADTAESSGDVPGLLAVIERHADRGRRATALEVAFRALSMAPADVRVHLAIARLHLAMGWRRRAVDEVARLARFADLAGDGEARRLVAAFVNDDLRGPDGRQQAAL